MQVLVTRTPEHAHWLVHFVRGIHIVTTEKGKAMEISYSDARSLVSFLWGFILWYQGTCFYATNLCQQFWKLQIYWNIRFVKKWVRVQVSKCLDCHPTIMSICLPEKWIPSVNLLIGIAWMKCLYYLKIQSLYFYFLSYTTNISW
jgi:hypothetical protein